ncbi:MAG: hydrogenase accessory protein HypB [Chloroflexota bacterium]|nr:MAG: hydrogenase accessory protein HypB [Chloroflexota bacterium]
MDLDVQTDILEANDAVAAENRRRFDAAGLLVINLMSSPGSGKTTLLEKMAAALAGQLRIGVIEGDIATSRDADRLTAVGVPAVQISTGSSCHLNADMISNALSSLDLNALDVLFVENVGNLVCPAEFEIGEHYKVTLLSTTEGDEKPLKYPAMFHVCSAMVVNKLDLMPYTNFNLNEATANALSINPRLAVFPLSCTTGEGLDAWISWVTSRLDETRKRQK